MRAQDVMTTPVVSVGPNATVDEVAALLLEKGISAVPVIDAEGSLYGMVSEADLLHRPEIGTARRSRWWLEMFKDSAALADNYARSRGTRARDEMTPRIVDVAPEADLFDVLSLMERHGVRRVLVIEEKRLVGILTRANILRGLLANRRRPAVDSSDQGIRRMVLDELAKRYG